MLLRSALENKMRFQQKTRAQQTVQAPTSSLNHVVTDSVWIQGTEEPTMPRGPSPLATDVTNSAELTNEEEPVSAPSIDETPEETKGSTVSPSTPDFIAIDVIDLLNDSSCTPSASGKKKLSCNALYGDIYCAVWQTEFATEALAQQARDYLYAAAQYVKLPAGSVFVRDVKSLQYYDDRPLYICNHLDCEYHEESAMKQREGKFAQELEREKDSKKVETLVLPPVPYRFNYKFYETHIPKSPSSLRFVVSMDDYAPPDLKHVITSTPVSSSKGISNSETPKKKKKTSKPSWYLADEKVNSWHVENADPKPSVVTKKQTTTSTVVTKKQTTTSNAFKQSKPESKNNRKKAKKSKNKAVSQRSQDDRDQYIVMDDDDIFDRS